MTYFDSRTCEDKPQAMPAELGHPREYFHVAAWRRDRNAREMYTCKLVDQIYLIEPRYICIRGVPRGHHCLLFPIGPA